MAGESPGRDLGKGIGVEMAIFAACVFMPLFGLALIIFIPLPALFYRIKLGPRIGGLVPLVSFLLIAVLSRGFSLNLLAFGALLGLGWLMGDAMERRLPVELVLLKTCGLIIAVVAVVMFTWINITGNDFAAGLEAYITVSIEEIVPLYRDMGMTEEVIQAVIAEKDHFAWFFTRILPAVFCSMLLVTAWAVLLTARPLLLVRGLPFPDYGPLNLWKPPEFLVWAAIAAGMTLFMDEFRIIGANIVILLMPVYFFSGIGVISWFFEQKKLPALLRVFFFTLIALQQFLLFLVISIGFFDIWFNFRNRSRTSGASPGAPSDEAE